MTGIAVPPATAPLEDLGELCYAIDPHLRLRLGARQPGRSRALTYAVTGVGGPYLLKVAARADEEAASKLVAQMRHLEVARSILDRVPVQLTVPELLAPVATPALVGYLARFIDGEVIGHELGGGAWTAARFRKSAGAIMTELRKLWTVAEFELDTREMGLASYERAQRGLKRCLDGLRALGLESSCQVIEAKILRINGRRFEHPLSMIRCILERAPWSTQPVGRLCVSGDAIWENVIATDRGGHAFIDLRGHCARDHWHGLGVPVLDPIFDLGKMLMSLAGWTELCLGSFRLDLERFDLEPALRFTVRDDATALRFDQATLALLETPENVGLCTGAGAVLKGAEWPIHLVFTTAIHFLADVGHTWALAGTRALSHVMGDFVIASILLDRVACWLSRPPQIDEVAAALAWARRGRSAR
jgi:hypothetical protein